MDVVDRSVHDGDFGFDRPEESHLRHEFDAALEAEGAVALVGIQVQLGRDAHLSQLPVEQGRSVRGIGIELAVVEADGTGLSVEGEDGAQRHVGAVAVPRGWDAGFSVRGRIGRGVGDSPVDVAGQLVEFVHGVIGPGLGTRGQQQGQMGAGRHRDDADLLRIEATHFRFAPYAAHRPLTVFPGRLVDGKARRPRRPVHEVHALDADFREFFLPVSDEPHVAAILIGAARDEDHAYPFLYSGIGRGEPVQIGVAERGRIEARCLDLIGHRGNLEGLCIRDTAFRPDIFPLLCRKRQAAEQGSENEQTFHGFFQD